MSKYYVTMKDTFMSDWGPAEGKDNILVLHCDTKEEAEIVAENARNRGDQINIRIRDTYYYYNPKFNCIQDKTRDDMPLWYKKGGFKK